MATVKISELTPDPRNANKGTERGRAMLEESLRRYGAGRSILIDREGRVIAGNKTLETAAQIGLDEIEVIQTDGKKIVAVQRMDLDLVHDKAARELAYADNRVGQVDLDFDAETLLADVQSGVDLAHLWTDGELEELFGGIQDGMPILPSGEKSSFRQITFTLHNDQAECVEDAIRKSKAMGDFVETKNENGNGNALARICEAFLCES